MKRLVITTTVKDEVVDITEKVNNIVQQSGVERVWCGMFVTHTTCCLTTADLDPGTDKDLLDALRKISPDLPYRHPHNPSHASDHILSSLIGPSLVVLVENGQIFLGDWQRIVLVELNGPRKRTILLSCINEK